MTKEEASFYLANMDRKYMEKGMSEALDMAIQALSQESKTGHWIEKHKIIDYVHESTVRECSECGAMTLYQEKYCHKCGAKMVEPQESEVSNG